MTNSIISCQTVSANMLLVDNRMSPFANVCQSACLLRWTYFASTSQFVSLVASSQEYAEYPQNLATSALCSGSEIPKLGRAELSGHHHWWKNTIFLLVLAVHGMIIWSYMLWGCRWRSFGSTYCSGWGVRAAPGTLARALWPLVMVIWKFCSGPGARAVPGIVRHAIMPHLEVIWQFWSTCCNSAAGGHLKVLQWVRGQGCPWDSITCCNAAAGGHLEVLQWSSS